MLFNSYSVNSRNIKLIYLTEIGGIGRSLFWFVTPFIVIALEGANTDLGDISGISTIIGLTATLFGGFLSDRFNKRAIFLRLGLLLQLIGLISITLVTSLQTLLVGTILLNLANGFLITSKTTIIADSTLSNEKNRVFSLIFVFENIFFGIGNLVAFLVFRIYGSSIYLPTLLFIVLIASLIAFFELIIGLLIKDVPLINKKGDQTKNLDSKPESDYIIKVEKASFFNEIYFRIPFIVTLSGWILSFGAGLSILFLPIFFNTQYNINLDILSLIFAIMIFITAMWGKVMGDLADKFGRTKSIVFTQLIAVLLLYLLAIYPPFIFALITLLVRNAFMNASSPVVNALITDNTLRQFRARWISIQTLGWTILFGLGNIIGGRMIDQLGFWAVFFSTATLYLISTILILLIKEPEDKSMFDI